MLKDIIPFRKKKNELKKHQESDLFSDFHKQFNNLFENFFNNHDESFGLPSIWKNEKSWSQTPEIDISENNKEIKVEANLPGLDENNIKVNLDGDKLIIEAEHCEEKEDKNKEYYVSERRFGKFQRVIPLREDIVDKDNIKASLKKGVLKVTLPKIPGKGTHTKKIEITAR